MAHAPPHHLDNTRGTCIFCGLSPGSRRRASGHLDGSVRLWSYPELTDSQGLIRNVWPRLRSLLRGDPGLLELALERLLEHRRKQVGAQAGGGGQGADNARRELEEEARRELETVRRPGGDRESGGGLILCGTGRAVMNSLLGR